MKKFFCWKSSTILKYLKNYRFKLEMWTYCIRTKQKQYDVTPKKCAKKVNLIFSSISINNLQELNPFQSHKSRLLLLYFFEWNSFIFLFWIDTNFIINMRLNFPRIQTKNYSALQNKLHIIHYLIHFTFIILNESIIITKKINKIETPSSHINCIKSRWSKV